jgi:hypothetical protein
MKALSLVLLFLVALPMVALAQDPGNFPLVPVCDLRADGDADCSADAAVTADTVCVEGVVIAWKQFGVRGPGAIFDPVSGCCISIFDITNAPDFVPGSLVRVCGWMGAFSGLDEIIDNPANGSQDPVVTDLQSTGTYPCTPISCSDIANGSPLAETLESCAVSLCGHFVDVGSFGASSANYKFVDAAGDTCDVRIDSDTGIQGTAIPVGDVTVKAVLAQFDNFGAIPCGGYQLLPRSLADLTPGTCTVAVEQRTWGAVKDQYRKDED